MKRLGIVAALALLFAAGLAGAWWVKGHESIAEAGAAGLPEDMPPFFRAGGKTLAHCAGDPDRWKNPSAKFLKASEAPDHYIDLENYQGKELPPDRWKAIALLQDLKEKPETAGMLPYAIMENYDRLSCAFYDHRADPKNPAIQAKCLVYAGVLAHFTGDCAMPLHTTRDYDGRKADGKTLQKGIHAKIDGFPEKFGITAEEMSRGLKAKAVENVWAHILKQINDSYAHIDR